MQEHPPTVPIHDKRTVSFFSLETNLLLYRWPFPCHPAILYITLILPASSLALFMPLAPVPTLLNFHPLCLRFWLHTTYVCTSISPAGGTREGQVFPLAMLESAFKQMSSLDLPHVPGC